MTPAVVDLFGGPGGWDLAAVALGLHPVGVEVDADACATRYAAGLATWQQDAAAITDDQVRAFAGLDGLIGSPPCPTFSMAGKGAGRRALGELRRVVIERARSWSPIPDGCTVDPVSLLILEPLRWVHLARPRWVALEQVPTALPIWHAYDVALSGLGYTVVTGKLNAADYGVPQTRQRAFLIARRGLAPGEWIRLPRPTHASHPTSTRRRWVSMAEALGVSGRVGFPRRDDRGDSPDGYRTRDMRDTNGPAFALTEKARTITGSADNGNFRFVLNTGLWWKPGGTRDDAQKIDGKDPAPTLTAKSGGQWQFRRPATTVAGDPRVWPPGHKRNADDERRLGVEEAAERYGDRAGSEAIRLSVPDALVLQSFPPDYPVQGTKSSQFRQVGNAVPPLLAWHVLAAAAGISIDEAVAA